MEDMIQARFAALIGAAAKVGHFFQGDADKTYAWFSTDNPLMGGICPLDMLLISPERLHSTIDQMLEENSKG